MLVTGARFVGYASEMPAGRQIDVEMGGRWRDVVSTIDPWTVICPAARKQRPAYRFVRSTNGPGSSRHALFTTGNIPILGVGKAGRKDKVFVRYEIALEEVTGALSRAAIVFRDRRHIIRLVHNVDSFEVLPGDLGETVFQMPSLPPEAALELEGEVTGLSRERVMAELSKKWGEQYFKPFWLGQRVGDLPLSGVQVEPLTARRTPYIYLSYGFGSDERIDVRQWPVGSPEANAWWNENEPNRKLQVGDFPAQLREGPDLIVSADGTLLVIEGFSQTDPELVAKAGQNLAAL